MTKKAKRAIIIIAVILAVFCILGVAAFELLFGGNATVAADWMKNIANGPGDYKFYSDENILIVKNSGEAFHAGDCFDEQTGEYRDVTLSYALYVPDDYKSDGRYAMVTIDNPATNKGAHPLESVLTSRTPAYFASDEAQQLVKDSFGLDGIIVVVPTILERVGDNASAPAEYVALVRLWDYIQKEYSIDKDYIYGIGQSVGGMVLLETNTKRDNYFAGILLYDDQWGQNYYKDDVFARNMAVNYDKETSENTPRMYPATDTVAWNYYWDDNGEKTTGNVDTNNYYFMTSDDNILIMNSENNYLSNGLWQEENLLYKDLTGYEIPRYTGLDHTASLDDQNAAVTGFLTDTENKFNDEDMGIYWITFEGGDSMTTAVWSRELNAPFEWLMSQSRTDEMSRAKLDINKPFSGKVVKTADRAVTNFYDINTDEPVYYYTGDYGSGTQFYNTSWLNIQVTDEEKGTYAYADKAPGWLPDGMDGYPVEEADIVSATDITESGNTVIGIEYSTDMTDAVIHLKGEPVTDSHGKARDDGKVKLDPFVFFDKDGNQIETSVTDAYGDGNSIIVELDGKYDVTSVMQRTTIYTSKAISSVDSNRIIVK